MKKILFCLLALISVSAAAQHELLYVAETDAMSFYMDSYIKKGKEQVDTVWEKRIFHNNAAGHTARKALKTFFPKINIKNLNSYYVKEVFDLKNNRTRMLAIYLFNKQMDEIGYKEFGNQSTWQGIRPQTITDLQLQFVKKYRNTADVTQ